eukprot:4858346-Karenia_brevis.AAC.1
MVLVGSNLMVEFIHQLGHLRCFQRLILKMAWSHFFMVCLVLSCIKGFHVGQMQFGTLMQLNLL